MSEEHPEPDQPLDPATDARIRALLAELGSASGSDPATASMPPEVSARLEETLAGLVSERGVTDREQPAATVVPLRRRWSTRAAVAAAAVIVVGAGGVAAANLGVFGGGSVTSDSASSGAAGGTESPERSSSTPPSGSSSEGLSRAVPSLSAASFGRDVTALVSSGTVPAPGPRAGARSQKSAVPREGNTPRAPLRGTGCSGPRIIDGATPLLVRYDGAPAVLVIHPERGGSQLVEAWTCAGDRKLDSATVPASHATSGTGGPGSPGLGGASPSP